MPGSDLDGHDYDWIDIEAVKRLEPGCSVILFGAGQGSVEFIDANTKSGEPFDIRCIVDNDRTMWGKDLGGVPITSPRDIADSPGTLIVITTVSGKESVASQLTGMGYEKDADFVAVGQYPANSTANLELFLEHVLGNAYVEQGSTILHVGPGGFLGLECCLHALGFSMISMDANTFGTEYPDVTHKMQRYRRALDSLLALPVAAGDPDGVSKRFLSLFHEKNGRDLIDDQAIPFHFPHSFSNIPLDDGSVDAVVSFAVLEHVRHPERVVREIARVLKPGGVAFQKIITRDHRSFSKVSGYHPFSYLLHDETAWEAINKDKFYQNRLLPHEWEALFRAHLSVRHMATLEPYPLAHDVYAEIKAHRPDLQRRHLENLNCVLIATRRGR